MTNQSYVLCFGFLSKSEGKLDRKCNKIHWFVSINRLSNELEAWNFGCIVIILPQKQTNDREYSVPECHIAASWGTVFSHTKQRIRDTEDWCSKDFINTLVVNSHNSQLSFRTWFKSEENRPYLRRKAVLLQRIPNENHLQRIRGRSWSSETVSGEIEESGLCHYRDGERGCNNYTEDN